MTIIKVPKPPQSAIDKDRPVSSLLRTQLEHIQEAEFRLPAQQQTNIYINAIKTEGAAAEYIRQVTAAVHEAHGQRVARAKPRLKGRPGVALAAAAAPKGKGKSARNAGKKGANKAKTGARTGSKHRS